MLADNTSEVQDFQKTGKKLNEWTEEEKEIDVVKPQIDPENKRVTYKTIKQKVTEKVYYASSTPRKVICGNHFMLPFEPHKYIFKCKNCDYHFKGNTLTHKYDSQNGKILLRSTGQIVV